MEVFFDFMDLTWELLQTPFTLYGYTFTYQNVIYLILIAALIALMFKLIFST